MAKRTTFLLACAATLGLLMSQPAEAQTLGLRTPSTASKNLIKQKVTPFQRLAKQNDLKKKYPLLCKVNKPLKSVTATPFATVKKLGKKNTAAIKKVPVLRAAEGRELYGNVIYSSEWEDTRYGLYTFNVSDYISPSSLWINDNMAANGGGALVNGVFHEVNYYMSDGYVFINYYSFNAETGEELEDKGLTDLSLIATEMAVAQDGTVYGEFFNSTVTDYELGVMDYTTMTRSTIGTLNNAYVALGVTSDKTLYGVASDGNLYKIDPKTAKETLVGETGVTVLNSEGTTYGQSGEIDAKTGIFYWASISGEGASALYTVDLETGAAMSVGDFAGSEQVLALSIPKPAAEDGAPAAVDEITFDFSGASTTGKVIFTAPSQTFAGGELSGELSYSIEADGEEVATGTTTAGARVEQEVTVSGSGTHSFVVTTSNGVGKSPKSTAETYVGYDEPFGVEDIKAKVNSETGLVTLTWSAPTGGSYDAYMGDITYNVFRYPDGEQVATGLTETTFSETLTPDELTSYYYGIVAVNGDQQSGEMNSGKVVVGPALQVPYDNDFADDSSLNLMTIIDANNDGCTWGYHYEEQCAYNVYSSEQADDWMLTPPLKLEANKEYTVSFTASNTLESCPERLEVKYGEGDDPTAFTGVLLQPTVIDGDKEVKEYTATILPTKNQTIKIGFHAISDADMFNLLLRGVHVSAGSELSAPDSVANLTVTPAEQGELKATVKFTVPTKTIGGKTLTSVTKAEILRNDTVVSTLSSGLTPGAVASYIDTVDEDGTQTYKVVLYNESGIGRAARSQKVFVGTDVPASVNSESVSVKDNTSSLLVSWDAVETGKNGGYVDPSQITYNLYDNLYYDDFYGWEYGNKYGSVKGQNSCNVSMNTESGDLRLIQVYIQPENKKGYGYYGTSQPLVIGKSLSLPFTETFANGGLDNFWWETNDGVSSWGFDSQAPSVEGESGACYFDGCGDESHIGTGKIAPAGASNLKLYFKTKVYSGAQATFDIQVQTSDMSVETLKTLTFDGTDLEDGTTSEWKTEEISLAKYANEPYIIVRFSGNGTGYVYLDDVTVRNVLAKDLSAKISAPEKIKKGNTANVSVKVTNEGEQAANGFTVRLLAGTDVVAEKTVNETLQSMSSTTMDFTYTPSILDDNTSVDLTAEVVYDGDLNADNNIATATVTLKDSPKNAPQSADVKKTSEGVELTWTAPLSDKGITTETFDNYDAWEVDEFGSWTSFDGDKGTTGQIFGNYTYGYQGEPFAFEIFQPKAIYEDILENNPEMAPHSGDNYAVAVYSFDEDNFLNADNWLISPALSGKAQTVKFFALNQADSESSYPETVELLYSTTGTATEDFTLVKTVTVENGSWEEVSFDVPEGATHFAIRHVTENGGFVLGIDDVTYDAGGSDLTGYNIYRDGMLVKNVDAGTLKYVDTTNPSENAVYAVTAVYADGESASVKASLVPSSIEEIEALNKSVKYNVYTLDGKHVGNNITTTKNLKKGVYIVNGQKITVK